MQASDTTHPEDATPGGNRAQESQAFSPCAVVDCSHFKTTQVSTGLSATLVAEFEIPDALLPVSRSDSIRFCLLGLNSGAAVPTLVGVLIDVSVTAVVVKVLNPARRS